MPKGTVKMNWLGILLISPIWGPLSTQFFIQAWLSVAQFFIYLVGFVKGSVPRKDNAIHMGVAICTVALFSLLLRGGFWLLTVVLPFGQTQAENIVYWLFAGLSWLYFIPQIPSKLRASWRYATIPNALWLDSLMQKIGLNSKH